jgi:serine/threonine protein kinase
MALDSKKTITLSRIEFVKNIIGNNRISPMIDFDDPSTESAMSPNLNKKIMDIKDLLISMNLKLVYLKSGTTGHTFKAISIKDKNVLFAVKVCAYPKDEYGPIHNLARPENAELRMLKLLSHYVITRKTPHFVLPICTFNTSILNFVNIPKNIIDPNDEKNEMYRRFIERYHEGEFEDYVSVLISEWCNGGDLLEYIRKNYKIMTFVHWSVIFFQILFTLALVHDKYPAFRHNDMKANNILVHFTRLDVSQKNAGYRYNIGDFEFIIPNIDLQVKIWDFDFACIDGIIENSKVDSDWTKKIGITKKQNRYYDMHYFLNTLASRRFFPQFYEGGVPNEIVEFIHRVIPEEYRMGGKYVNKKGRLQVDVEYTTPYKVITQDPLFNKYRFRKYSYRIV